ncbi:MAG: right-handed parallel beta-helix repeat-containing protein [Paludibacter sp.]
MSVILAILLTSCNDEIFSTSPNDKLSFSKDTLTFDTVFSTVGSATSKILVYNRTNYALKISQLYLAGGTNSDFKINVDGSLNPLNQFKDVEIRAKDSMYIFVSVTVKYDSPLFIRDSIVFLTNGVFQNVKLEAFGQTITVLRGKVYSRNTTLSSTIPFLIYDSLVVKANRTLTIKPGCKFYFHNNANLIVYGNLKAEGTFDNPILMRGDRLDDIKFSTPFPYNNVAGQWGGIFLLGEGTNHVFSHVNMNSGYVGIYVRNNSFNNLPNLQISDCRIHNFLLYGLIVQNANVTVTNSEISNTSSYSVYLNGGKHTFLQSTIANYFDNSSVQPTSRDKKPALMIMNLNRVAPMQTVFRNCIISGNYENEFSLASRYLKDYDGTFDHCYIRKPDSLNLPDQFKSICWSTNKDTLFKSIRYDYEKKTYFNFMPDSVSPVRGKADPVVAAKFPLDLNGNPRNNKPDIGAYQWQPVKK